MKEFLVNHNGKWTLQLLDSDIEENSYRVAVPSGSIEARLNRGGSLNFIRADGCWMSKLTHGEWFGARDHSCHKIVWQRPKSKSLNDQYTEIEQVRQETVKVTIDELKHRVGVEPNKTTINAMNEADAMFADAVNNPSHYSDSSAGESKHSHYKKDVSHLDSIDVYRVLELFNVQSHAVGHAIKKLLCSGWRGAKDEAQDIQEAIDSLIRYQEMKNEDYVLFDS